MPQILFSTDEEIRKLIQCPKVFTKKPSKPTEKNRNVSQRFAVYGQADNEEFQIFITYSSRIPQDFSLGLMLGDDYLLFRCNGFHGTTKNGFYSVEHHAYPHSHTLTISDISNSRERSPSFDSNLIGVYIDLQTARLFFFKHCGILGFEKYFAAEQQMQITD